MDLSPTAGRLLAWLRRYFVARAAAVFVVVGLLYAAGSRVAFHLIDVSDLGAVFFIPAGMTLAALLLLELRLWPFVIAAAAVAELCLDLSEGISAGAAAGFVLANTLEPVVAALLLRRRVGRVTLDRRADTWAFVAFGAGAGCAVGAAVGATTRWIEASADWAGTFGHWWLGDALGVLTVAAPLVALRSRRTDRSHAAPEALLFVVLMTAVSVPIYWWSDKPVTYLPVTILVLAAVRSGVTLTAWLGLLMTLLATAATANGHGYWSAVVGERGLLYLQLLLGILLLTGLVVAAEAGERQEATRERARAERAQAQARRLQRLAERLSGLGEGAPAGVAVAAREAAGAASACVYLLEKPTARLVLAHAEHASGGPDGAPADPPAFTPPAGAIVVDGRRAVLPLADSDGTLGCIVLRFADAPVAGREAFLTVVAQQATAAMRRALLHESDRAARIRSGLLHDLAAALAGALTPNDVGDAFLRRSLEYVGAESGALMMVDPDGKTLSIAAVREAEDADYHWLQTLPVDADYATAVAFRSGQRAAAFTRDEVVRQFPDTAANLPRARATLALPVLGPEGPIGAVALMFPEERGLSADNERMLTTMTRLCAQAIERARLYQAEREARERAVRNRARAELLSAVAAALEEQIGLRDRARALLGVLVPRVADYGSVERVDPADGTVELLAAAHVDPDRVETLEALRTRHRLAPESPGSVVSSSRSLEPHLIEELSLDVVRRFTDDPATVALIEELGPRSHMTVPIAVRGRVLGVLLLGLSDPARRPYAQGDLEFVEEIAARAGVALENARLYEQEHEIAAELQRAMLPDRLYAPEAVEVAFRYVPGHTGLHIGGDWYDAIRLPGGRVGLTVGDVVGHGLRAASAMGQLRTALAALAPQAPGPARLLRRLEDYAAGVEGGEYATCCYAELDPATGALRYAAAGHPPPLVVAPDGAVRFLHDGRSPPLCGLDAPRDEGRTVLEPGSLLVFYSDGLVERRGVRISEGLDRLAKLSGRPAPASLEDLCDEIVSTFTASGPAADDIVLLVVRLLPVADPAFVRSLPAHPESLAVLRRELRAWLADRIPEPDHAPVLLAVGEACSNAVEHAYAGLPGGDLSVRVERTGRDVLIEVRDTGRWRDVPGTPDRGRGTMLMRGLADDFDRRSDETGTAVRMRRRVVDTIRV